MLQPKHYKMGLNGECFSTLIFWGWLLYGFLQSLLVYFLSFNIFNWAIDPLGGRIGDLWMIGTFAYGAIVILSNSRIAYDSHSHYTLTIIFLLLSIGSFFLVFYLMNLWSESVLFYEYFEINKYPVNDACKLFLFFAMFLIDSFINFVSTTYK